MDCLDVCYKKIGQIPVRLNVYYPPNLDSSSAHPGSPHPRLPAVVYFHGGGLTVGNRTSWFPTWLKGLRNPLIFCDRYIQHSILLIQSPHRRCWLPLHLSGLPPHPQLYRSRHNRRHQGSVLVSVQGRSTFQERRWSPIRRRSDGSRRRGLERGRHVLLPSRNTRVP